MVAYYEAAGAHAPAHLLPQGAQVLGVGVYVLLGIAQLGSVKRLVTNRLERRLLAIEKLDPRPGTRSFNCWTRSSSARSSSAVNSQEA